MSLDKSLQTKIFDKVNPLVRFSVTRYVLSVAIFVGIALFGIVSVRELPVDLLPTVNIPVVSVTTSFPGAAPDVVDQLVTQVVENRVSTIAGITDINSSSSLGFSRVVLNFEPSIDRNAAANQVSSILSSASSALPSSASVPSVRTFDPNAQAVLQFGIVPNGKTMEDVGQWVTNTLSPILVRVQGVANIQVDGAPTRQFQVLLDPAKLVYARLNPQSVSQAIAQSSINQPIGTIISQGHSMTFVTNNQPNRKETIEEILVDAVRGVQVSEVAVVRDVSVNSAIARVNGKPAVLVSIQRTTDSNAVAVVKSVREALKKVVLPQGFELEISNDTTGPINASVESTYHELFLTALIVALICLLFLGKVNTAFSVVLAIPIALAASPILYNVLGFSFNLVSLLAMIVAIGIVVDDSIVVSENVDRYRQMGYSAKEAVLKGASEVFSAVVAASLSILAVLLPVSFVGSAFIRGYLSQFSLGLAAAVLLSLLEAVLFLTVRLAYTPDAPSIRLPELGKRLVGIVDSLFWGLRSWKKGFALFVGIAGAAALAVWKIVWLPAILAYPLVLGLLHYAFRIALALLQVVTNPLHGATEAVVLWISNAYSKTLRKALRFSAWILVGAGALFCTVFVLWPQIPFNFVPQSDGGTLQVNLRLPSGTPAEVTNRAAGRLEAWILKQKEVVTVQTVLGSGGSSGLANSASMILALVDVEKRKSVFVLSQEYRRSLLPLVKDIPSAQVSVSTGGFRGGGPGGSLSINFALTASDFKTLTETNGKVVDFLQKHKDVVDVNSDLNNTSLQNTFVPDPFKVSGSGLTAQTIATTLQTYSTGIQAANVAIGGINYPILVTINPIYLSGKQSLLDLPIYSSSLQAPLKIGQLGEFKLSEAPISLSRSNRLYSTGLDVNLKPTAPAALAFQNQIVAQMREQGILPEDANLGPANRFGPTALAADLAVQGLIAFALAIFLAYLVMASQFNSWRYPIYLFLPVPLAIVGALGLVWAMGTGLDIFGLLGMLMLIGLSAKNAILYLDFVVERLDHMPFGEALVESAKLRFRPIVMTTLTVLVISFPLMLGSGQGSEFGQKLGIVMLGGVVSSAILTFFVVPAAFYVFERKKHPDEKIVPFGTHVPDPSDEIKNVRETREEE